jgi:D-arabinose 1-dehydrogenase-like Zn-dependent alcohol dehydrogenase
MIIKTNGGDEMLELFLNEPNDIEIRNAETLPRLKEDEVKVKLIYGGICGSDLRVFQGKIPYAAYPLQPGHELLGYIVEVGENVWYEAAGTSKAIELGMKLVNPGGALVMIGITQEANLPVAHVVRNSNS